MLKIKSNFDQTNKMHTTQVPISMKHAVVEHNFQTSCAVSLLVNA